MEKHLIYVTTGTNHYNFDRMLYKVQDCMTLIQGKIGLILQYGASSKINIPFCKQSIELLSRNESEKMYKNANLIFSHCGIGSIYNSLKYNTPTILIPRLKKYNEFSDDHQLQIANEIERNPLIYIIHENNKNIEKEFIDFYKKSIVHKKKEIDLINYELAHKIKSVFYRDNA